MRWEVNGKAVGVPASGRVLDLAGELARKGPRGSITLFTNGQTITCDSLRVAGPLSSEWLETTIRRRALNELKKAVSDVSWHEIGGK